MTATPCAPGNSLQAPAYDPAINPAVHLGREVRIVLVMALPIPGDHVVAHRSAERAVVRVARQHNLNPYILRKDEQEPGAFVS